MLHQLQGDINLDWNYVNVYIFIAPYSHFDPQLQMYVQGKLNNNKEA